MAIRKWIMKQYWRLVQVRGIWNLFYGVLLLAVAYYAYVPVFLQMGAAGPLVFAALLLGTFLFLGYLYDRVFVLWGPQQEVVIERNPYQYVPHPRDKILWFPVYTVFLNTAELVLSRLGRDATPIRETREYFAILQTLTPYRKEDLQAALKLRNEFIARHPFSQLVDEEDVDTVATADGETTHE